MRTIDYSIEPPVVEQNPSLSSINESIARPLETRPTKGWYIAISISLTMLLIGAASLGWTLYKGVGVWGVNQPVGWGFDIVNFVFWVGIGHAVL